MSPQQFLDAERKAAFKSEYFNGDVYAMAGGTRAHVRIEANLAYEAVGQLRGRDCEALGSNIKVWIPSAQSFVYPDLAIACGSAKMRDEHADVLENPIAIFEILSPSTEKYDRTRKFDGYCSIPGFQQYVLIAQDSPRVEVYTRSEQGSWVFTRFSGLEATATLSAIGFSIPLASLYDRVQFEPEPPESNEVK